MGKKVRPPNHQARELIGFASALDRHRRARMMIGGMGVAMRGWWIAGLLALGGCQWAGDALDCNDLADQYRAPVTVYETACHGGLAPGCTTRPQTELRETAQSKGVMQSCLADRRIARAITRAHEQYRRTGQLPSGMSFAAPNATAYSELVIPPPPPQPTAQQ